MRQCSMEIRVRCMAFPKDASLTVPSSLHLRSSRHCAGQVFFVGRAWSLYKNYKGARRILGGSSSRKPEWDVAPLLNVFVDLLSEEAR